MNGFIERIKQYPAQEQVDLKVRVKVPGSLFPGLTPDERMAKYEAQATQAIPAHRLNSDTIILVVVN